MVACGPEPASGPEPPQATSLTIGIPEATVAAADAGLRALIDLLTVEPLIAPEADGRTTPRLAESWGWENDGLLFRLRLREGITFHDGTTLDAEVTAAILGEIRANAGAVGLYPALADVESITADGPLDVVFELSRPSAFLPADLSIPLRSPTTDVGTGPFRLVESSALSATLERFDDYYQGAPQLELVQIQAFDSLRPAWASLLRGDLDMVNDVPPDAIDFVQSDDVRILRFARPYQYVIAYNSTLPPFDQPAVRRALNMAVDRAALVQDVLGESDQASAGPIRPQFWAYDETVAPFAFDPGAAGALLDQAGVGRGGAQNSNIPGARFRFTMVMPEGFAVWERLALEVQRYLYDVGVDMQIEVVSVNDYNVRIRDGAFGAVLLDMASGPTLSRSYEVFWRSAENFQGFNVFGYENAEAEEIFEGLRVSIDNDAAIRTATRRLQTIFIEDPPALFLAWKGRTMAVRNNVQVVADEGQDPLGALWRWQPAVQP